VGAGEVSRDPTARRRREQGRPATPCWTPRNHRGTDAGPEMSSRGRGESDVVFFCIHASPSEAAGSHKWWQDGGARSYFVALPLHLRSALLTWCTAPASYDLSGGALPHDGASSPAGQTHEDGDTEVWTTASMDGGPSFGCGGFHGQ
jgi:hypothetical protein